MTNDLVFYVAEYIRLSREDGDKAESDSIKNQKKLITDFIKDKKDFILYDTYIDDGFSGTNFNRPSFKRMISDIEAKKVNCVIVKDLSRFGRDYIDTGKYLERYFPDNNIRFIAITDNIDSIKQTYDMLLPIKNIFNEQYARDISKKVHASMSTKQKAGEFIGAFAPYGYKKSSLDKNKLIIDEYASGIIRRIFDLYSRGYGKIRIANLLNEEGIVCPSEYKKINGDNYRNSNRLESTSYWTYSTINRILQNEMYLGHMVQGKKIQYLKSKPKTKSPQDWIIVKNTHEPIIDNNTWNKVQILLKCRTRQPHFNPSENIFAGFLKCSDCGRSLVKKISTSQHGKKMIHYYCGTYVRSGKQYCTPHYTPYWILEKIILEDLKIMIQNVKNLENIIENQNTTFIASKQSTETEKKRLIYELQKIQKWKKNIYEDYQEELISKKEYLIYRQDYQKKEELLVKQLSDLEQSQAAEITSNIFENPWIEHLLKLREIEKLDRNIIVEMIHEIKISENHKIKITYNFSDELEHLFASIYTNAPYLENITN